MGPRSAVPVHALRGDADEAEPDEPRPREADSRPLGLSLLDQLAATAFVGLDEPAVIDLTRDLAAALTDEDVTAARASRRRMVARLLAIEKTTYNAIIGLLGLRVRDGLGEEHALRVVRALDALANSSCRRLTMLLGAESRNAAVAIENAIVRVEAE